MAAKYHPLSLKEPFSFCQDMSMDNTLSFFQLLNEHFDISQYIPPAFFHAFTDPEAENVSIPLQDSYPPSSSRRFFLFLPTPCLSGSCPSARNCGTTAAFPKCQMHLCSHVLSRTSFLTLNRCSNTWSISRNPSAR